MACRFPGASDLDAFWQLLVEGKNAVTEGVPGSGVGRVGELYPNAEVQSDACRFGAFIEGIDQFDASFFRISPVEAQLLDPQQRLMLETSWQALEDACIDPERLKGSRTGVYIGISNMDYRLINLDSSQTAEAASSLYAVSGTSLNTAAGRVAFALGLEGPAMAVDTACSSSLVATHQAVSALQRGEADTILAGGVQAILSGRLTELRANARMLSPDGKCKAFDASANGFVRGEGCGIVVLKRLSDAEADGDRIWGVILGSALNQDGTSTGLTVPNEQAQASVINEALLRAGVAPSEVDYLEAHGTGTEVGDPIELNAAAEVYGRGREADRPLLVGSVKSNIGHLEPAAGVAGLMKVMLSLQNGLVPKHLHFRDPNPRLDWDRLPVKIATELTQWPLHPDRPPRAGISAYGWSGTNAHIVVEGYPDSATSPVDDGRMSRPAGPLHAVPTSLSDYDEEFSPESFEARPARILPLSGKTDTALREAANSYLSWLDEQTSPAFENGSASSADISDMAWTAGVTRSHFENRNSVVFRDTPSLRDGLKQIADTTGEPSAQRASKVAFAFTGQGNQWVGMGELLYRTEPVFRAVLDRCDRLIREERGASLLDVMFGRASAAGDLDEPRWTQPSIYALECGLTALWASIGIRPDAVLGHSLGEIAAAHASGVLTLEDGLRFAAARGQIMGDLPSDGAMAAIFAPESEVALAVDEWNKAHSDAMLCIGVDNGTHQVISGPQEAVHALTDQLESAGLNVRRLRPSPAYHSALVEPGLDEMEATIATLSVSEPTIPLVSNLTGQVVESRMDGAYWRQHARQPVAFRSCVETLAQLGVDAVIEIGPHAILGPLVSLNWPQSPGLITSPVVLQSLLRPSFDGSEPERADAFVQAVADAYGAGLPVDFTGLFAGEERRRISVPGYPFQRQRYWVPASHRRRPSDAHPLLGVRHDSARGDITFETEVYPSNPAWLKDHKVFGRLIAPGALYGAMAASASLAEGSDSVVLEDMQLHSALVFSEKDAKDGTDEDGRKVQVVLDDAEQTSSPRIQIYSKGTEDEWTMHVEGRVPTGAPLPESGARVDLEVLKSHLSPADVPAYYRAKSSTGIDLGPLFRTLGTVWSGPGEALGEVRLPEALGRNELDVHPLLLDGCFQVVGAARNMTGGPDEATYLPFGWDRMWLSKRLPDRMFCHVSMSEASQEAESPESAEVLSGEMRIYDPNGALLGELSGYTVKRATREALLSTVEGVDDLLYEVVWRERPLVGGLQSAKALARPTAASESIRSFADYLSSEGVAVDDRAMLLSDLERLSRSYSLAALEQLGWQRRRGETVEPDSLRDLLQIEPQHTKLVGRMLRLLKDGGLLSETPDAGGYIVEVGGDDLLPDEALADPEAFADKMVERYPHGYNELNILRRSGIALADGLRGTVDPLDVLFRSEGPGVTEYYFAAPASRASNRLLADAVARVVRDWTGERRLRVLEVGAGTGSATSVVLPELQADCDYMFTDISAGFFAEAEVRFDSSEIPIEYRPLDIEKEPSSQGFELHAYDLIIAANVLHATRDLGDTLTHCRELLAPSGQLMALENMRGRGWQDITFGLLDGWWRFADDYRPSHAMAHPSIWNRALLDSGYDEVSILGAEGADEGGPFGSSVILAQGPAQITESPGVWVLTVDDGGVAEELAAELSARNQTVVLADRDVAESRESWRSLIEGLPDDVPFNGVVHLQALAGHGLQAATTEITEDVARVGASALALVQGVSDSDVILEKGVWFVTRGAQVLERERAGELAGAVLWGMGKVVALEASHLRPRMIDLDPGPTGQLSDLVNELLYPDAENHIAYRSGNRKVARLVRPDAAVERLPLPEDSDWVLAPNPSGIFDKPEVKPLPPRTLEPKEVRVAVEAAGLNFWDVFRSLGFIEERDLGRELCGHVVGTGSEVSNVSIGERVVGLGFGAFGPEMITHEELVAPAPPGMSVSALATIPSAFVSAALSYQFSELEAGERVLIHAGTGGVGQAAIQLAQAAGAEVFATASAPKQALLRSLGVKHIFDSRQTKFGEEILEATGGEGVHVVLNSLTSEGFIDASLSCLTQGGRFVEMARSDILSHEEMAAVRPDVSYDILELDVMKETDPAAVGVVLRDVMARLSAGELGPIIHSRWPLAEAGAALDFMRSARHVGKIVLTPPPLLRGQLREDRTYLVTGGLGGIGILVAEWLADHGAGTIVLNGRRDPDPEAQQAIDSLRSRGIRIEVELADVTDTEAIDAMLERIDAKLPPLGGVIHSVGVLSDAVLTNQTWASFEQVLWPKIVGAWHLHRATMDRDLDLFILFSSLVGVMGNPGQANHAAANAFLDQLAGHRRAMGLPGQAIAWGAWSEIGEAAEQRERIEQRRAALGGRWFTPEQGIKALEKLVRQDSTTSVVMSMDWSVFEEAVQDRPPLLEDMLSSADDDISDDSAASEDVLSRLRSASAAGPQEVLVSFLQQEVQAVLRLSSSPSPTVGFFDLGMDSLMAVELRNRLNRAFAGEYVASNTVVFDYPDIASLASHIAEELGQLGEVGSAPSPSESPEPLAPEPTVPVRTDDDGIAVVGMACRFPGAGNLSEFWELLEAGADAITDGRRDAGSWSGAVGDPDAEDVAIRRGAFVDGIDWFDSRFFRISPIEARTMDPQQRMLLETSWEALEDGGLDPDNLRGSRTGVYAGIGGAEYRDLFQAGNREHNYLGTTGSVTVGRVSFALGLEGPALPVDMACASSLASVHQAVVALQRGEVDLALAGGVNAILSPGVSMFMMEVGMLSPTGHCTPFDASADGYVRGEGCGMVVLKRLSEAESDGDRIYAVIRGSAVNQNGASAGLTVPNGPAQERVMTEALAQAGASPSEVDYLEAHATGSQLGDPIELNAAASVYGKGREAERPLLVGSVKSNIGHIESAAGIAAFIKTVLSMNKGVIPKSLHIETPNPNFEWDQMPVRVTSDKTAWPTNSGRLPLAGVNAFGLSGTNAHVLVEGYDSPSGDDVETGGTGSPTGAPQPIPVSLPEQTEDVSTSSEEPAERAVRLLPISGKSEGALRESAKRYLSWLDGEEGSASDATLSDMAWTASVGRSHFPYRAGLVFSDAEQLRRELSTLAVNDVASDEEMPREATKVAFAYTGSERTWVGMGEALYRSEPVARAVLDKCDDLIRQERGTSLLDVMFGRPGVEHDLNDPAWAEPATYALQSALTAQWGSVGVRPSTVVAQGAGRLAAAQAAGVFGIDEGLRLAAALGELKETQNSQAASESLQTTLDGVKLAAPSLPLLSSANDQMLKSGDALDIDYWFQKDQSPTVLSGHAETLAQLGVDVVVEIGPDSTMGRRIRDAWPDTSKAPVVISTLVSPSGDDESPESGEGFVKAVAQAYEAGLDISFPGLFAGEVRRRISIPIYPFQRRRHWV